MKQYVHVPKSQIKDIDNYIKKNIICKLKERLSGKYVFDCRLVGSASKNLVVADKDGKFDLDYHIILSSRSHDSLDNASSIKNTFFIELKKICGKGTENSTTAVTAFFQDEENGGDFSIDFVLLRYANDPEEIIKRNINSKDTNAYTWCKLPTRYQGVYSLMDGLSSDEKNTLSQYIIEAKLEEKRKPSNPPKSGFEVFIQTVNNRVKHG